MDPETKTTDLVATTTNDVAAPDDEPIISVVVDSPVSAIEDRYTPLLFFILYFPQHYYLFDLNLAFNYKQLL